MTVKTRYVGSELRCPRFKLKNIEQKASRLAGEDLELYIYGNDKPGLEDESGMAWADLIAEDGMIWPSGDMTAGGFEAVPKVLTLFVPGSHVAYYDEEDAVFIRFDLELEDGEKVVRRSAYVPESNTIPWEDEGVLTLPMD